MTRQETDMSGHQIHDVDRRDPEASDIVAWQYASKAMTWYGWGSPVGLGLFIISIGAFLVLVHVAGVL
jgi:hypothetical protein